MQSRPSVTAKPNRTNDRAANAEARANNQANDNLRKVFQTIQTQSIKWAKYIEKLNIWAAHKNLAKKINILYTFFNFILYVYEYINYN